MTPRLLGSRLPEQLKLRPARPGEAVSLTELAFRSKAHWGYDAAFLEASRPDLTVTPETITPATGAGTAVLVAERDRRVVGFVAVGGAAPEMELVQLFVEPDVVRTGVGRRLVEGAVAMARARGATSLGVDSDPNAERFYATLGWVRVGDSPSVVDPNRRLPRLRLAVS